MLKTILKLLNDNHWYLIAVILVAASVFMTFSCESQVASMVKEGKMVGRDELQAEADYLVAMFKSKAASLDRQDAIKQAILDAPNIIGTGGSINPSGLINLAASVAGISFGLSQRQKLKNANKTSTTSST